MAENIGEVKFGISAEFDGKGTKEAERAIGKLEKLGGQTTQAFTGLKASFANFEKTVESMTGGLIGSSTALISVGKAAGVVGGVAAATVGILGMMAKSASEAAAGIDILSQRTGINATTLQEYDLLLNRNDVSQQQFAVGIQQLAKRMEELTNPTSEISKAFQQLGLEMGPGTPPDQAFQQIAIRVAQLPDGFQKTAAVMQIFGRSGGELIPVLNEMGRGMGEAQRRAHALGTVMSSDQIETLKKLDDAWDDFNKTLSGFTNNIGSLVAPIFTSIINSVTELIGKVSKLTQEWAKSPMNAADLNKLPQQYVDKQQALIDQRRESQFMPVMGTIASEMTLGTIKGNVRAHLRQRGEDVMKVIAEQIGIGLNKEKANLAQNESIRRGLAGMAEEMAKGQAALQGSLGGQIVSGGEVPTGFDTSLSVSGTQDLTTYISLQRQSISAMENQLTIQQAVAQEQAELYRTDLVGIDKASAARRVAFEEAQQQHDLTVAQLRLQATEFPLLAEQSNAKIVAADIALDTKRRQIVQAYPTFFEQQMQDLVNSNTFSLGQITSNFTNATAQWIVSGKGFEQFWQQLQITILQAFLNTSIQYLARLALQSAQELGIVTATNAAKLTSVQTTNTAIEASNAASGAASTTIWTGASTAIQGAFASVSSGFSAIAGSMVSVLTAVGTFVMGVLSAIADALTATVFGIPYAGAILLGVAAIGVAIAAGVGAFAKGGIVTGPTLGLVGEAGSSEAIIPLNSQGAGFMADMLGLGGGRQQEQRITLEIDGQAFRKWILRGLPDDVRLRAGAIA